MKKKLVVAAAALLLAGCAAYNIDMEPGDFSQITANGGGNFEPASQSCGSHTIDTSRVRGGTYSMKLTTNSSGGQCAERAFRWAEPRIHPEGIAADAYWFPGTSAFSLDGPNQFYNLMQFKSRTDTTPDYNDPVWALYLQQDGGGLYYQIGYGWGNTHIRGPYSTATCAANYGTGNGQCGQWMPMTNKIYVTWNAWNHIQCGIDASNTYSGGFYCKVNDVEVGSYTNVITSFNNCNYNTTECTAEDFSVNLYTDGTNPDVVSVWWDDINLVWNT